MKSLKVSRSFIIECEYLYDLEQIAQEKHTTVSKLIREIVIIAVDNYKRVHDNGENEI